eukprot:CAMPEP_0175127544 /NCGR_PEP_ID=MMETSP0087-20121206/4441_1 /TAXON_ID=136419 /ORGANISM="Unknown Unknown, Strain D1" /LENGTH=129 /DNA_ID=CAMNT_0016409525 /DNA_START=272 /DNA_END=661 /DNA_ORIENTATION=-
MCSFAPACPGASSILLSGATAQFDPTTCAPGYTGLFCTRCSPAYYSFGPSCRTCGLTADDERELYVLGSILMAWFVVVALGVTLLQQKKLTMFVSLLILLQQVSTAGSKVTLIVPGLRSFDVFSRCYRL